MYRGRLWTMRQYAGYATAEESNARYKYLLAQGTTGLVCRFRSADADWSWTQTIRWPPAKSAKSAWRSIRWKTCCGCLMAFRSTEVSTSMTINATAAILLCLYLAVARKQNVAFEKVSGTLQNDILKEYIARGTYIYPPAPIAAFDHRHVCVLRARSAQLEHDFDQRLSHSRSRLDRGPGSCFHARRRDRLRGSCAESRTRELMISRRAFLSFSTRTTTCWKRLPSFAPPGGCGRASCANVSTRAIRVR